MEELRLTDPEPHRGDQLDPDEVDAARKASFEPLSVDTFTVDLAAQPRGSGGRGSSPLRLLLVAVTVAVVVIGGRVIVSDRSGHHEAAAATGAAYVKNIPAAYRVTAERVAPLAAGMSVDCAGALVPVPMLAAPGGDEAGPSPAAAALREVLAHNPWSGTSEIVGGNWPLLAGTADRAVFGQRVGAMGVGTVVVLSRSGSSYRPENLTSCGTVVPGPNESGELIHSATAVGSSLELGWLTGTICGSRILDRVLVDQTQSAVRVIVISKPSPDAARGSCAGGAVSMTAQVSLTAPLGSRPLFDDSRGPGTPVSH